MVEAARRYIDVGIFFRFRQGPAVMNEDRPDKFSEPSAIHSWPAAQSVNPLNQLQPRPKGRTRYEDRLHFAEADDDPFRRNRDFIVLCFIDAHDVISHDVKPSEKTRSRSKR
jgi:hypothetical protein